MGPIIYVFSSLMKANLYILTFISFSISAILTLALVDLMYGVFVSPFYVENYVKIYWNQSMGYCRFFEFYFTFHDFFVPLVLILLSTYISLKYSGENVILKFFGDLIFFSTLEFGISTIFGFFQKSMLSKTSARKERRNKISICLRLYILLAATFKCANRNEINKACQNYKNTSSQTVCGLQ